MGRASSDVVVRFVGDTGNLAKNMDGLKGRFVGVATSLQGIAQAGAVVGALSFFKSAIDEAREAERVTRKTEAVLRSTGGQAGVTAAQVGALAGKLSELAGVDDEVIQQGANVLLTFTQIRNEAGKGNDVFDQAATAALDMAAALDKSGDSGAAYQENIIRIGKALNDPIKGMSALTKVGVSFTSQQKEQISSLVEQGKTMEAQKVILAELQKEFGGMAEAAADPAAKAAVAWGNFAEAVGTRVLPVVNAVGDWLVNTGIPKLDELATTVGDYVVPVFRNLAAVGREVVEFWQGLPGPVQSAVIALAAWQLIGDRVTQTFGAMGGSAKGFGDDVRTAMGAFDVNRVTGTFMALEERVSVLGQMGKSFRDNSSLAIGLGSAMGGLEGRMTQFGGVVKGTATAALTGLKAAGSSLVGFLGGPWGLAFAGAALGFGLLSQKASEAEARQREFIETGREVNEVLRENNYIVNSNVRMQLNKIASEERGAESGKNMLQIAREMGISYKDLNDAMSGNIGAFETVRQQLQGYGVDASGAISRNTDQARTAQDLYNWLGALNEGRISDAQSAKDQASANDAVTDSTAAATGAQQEMTSAAEEQKAAIDGLLDSLRAYWSESAAAADAQIAWEQQWDALAQSIKDNGTSLDIHTEKGRNNASALSDLLKTSQDMMAQDIAAKIPIDQAAQAHVNRTNALIAEAKRNGLNSAAVADLIGKYNGIPPDVTTWLHQKGFNAVRQNLTWLTAIQTLLKDGIEATPANINARMKKATGYTSSGKEDYAGGRASGGLIRGPGSGTSDTAGLFRLSDFEYVQRADATRYYGVGFMEALNQRRIPREILPGYAKGGLVAPYPVNMSKTQIPTRDQVENAFMRRYMPTISAGVGGSGVQRWAPLVLQVLRMLGQSAALLPNVLRRMNQESGGNPRAINLWDSNARKGTPSIGLMQTIGPTFNAYAGPFRSRGIYDPLANIYAGLNYAIHRYPSLQYAMDKPGGYRNGGWLKPGQLAYNETSRPEPVLSSSQWDKLDRLITALENGGMPGKVINVGGIHVANRPTDVMAQIARAEALAGI